VSTVYVFCFVSLSVPLTSLSVKSAAINRLASSEFCHMGYCTDILEIGFFDGKRANSVDSSECAHLYEDTQQAEGQVPNVIDSSCYRCKEGDRGNYSFRRDNPKNSYIYQNPRILAWPYIYICNTPNSVTLTYLLIYLLHGAVLEKLTGFQLVKKFSAFYGTQMFITAVTSAKSLTHMDYFLKCVIRCNIRRTQSPKSSTIELLAGLHTWVLKLAG
jgi:hypothetical protein